MRNSTCHQKYQATYIAISAKLYHCASEIVRHIEIADRKASAFNSKEGFCETAVKVKIRDYCKIITNDFPKQLMVATRWIEAFVEVHDQHINEEFINAAS